MEIKELVKRIIHLEKENERRFIENKAMQELLQQLTKLIGKIIDDIKKP